MDEILKTTEFIFEKDENAPLSEFVIALQKCLELHGKGATIEFTPCLNGVAVKIY